jgi:DNA-binding NtrC family response regulator
LVSESTESFSAALIPNEPACVPCLILQTDGGTPITPRRLVSLGRARAVTLSRAERKGFQVLWASDSVTLELPDRRMSRPHVELTQRGGQWRLEDRDSKNGVFLNGDAAKKAELEDGDVIEVGSTFLLFREQVETAVVDALLAREARGEPVESYSPLMRRGYDELDRIAPSTLPVLLYGETGTGKELAARRVHERSGRAGPFVAVNSAAISGQLAESELFGHVKGAFTGANEDRLGLIRASSGGTLFFDELAELERGLQSKLLRVLQEREVLPVGAHQPVSVDLRVVGATWRDLMALVGSGAFREDLLARLSGYRLELPPLRERREDLGALMATLLERQLGERAARIRFAREAVRALFACDWPRNVRQLEKALERAVMLAPGDSVELEHLPEEIREAERAASDGSDAAVKIRLEQALAEHAGNVSAVARDFGKERKQVRRWCRRFGIDLSRFRPGT